MAYKKLWSLALLTAILLVLLACAASPSRAAYRLEEEGVALDRKDGKEAKVLPGYAESLPSPAPADSALFSKMAGGSSIPSPVPGSSGLKAGYSDDNSQFGYFVDFLDKYKDVEHYAYNISERISLKISDSNGKSIANARLNLGAGGKKLLSGLSYADGSFRFYPAAFGEKYSVYEAEVAYGKSSAKATINRDGPRLVEIKVPATRLIPDPLPLDVLFVLDTTGSMGEEIERLKATIDIIHDNLQGLKPNTLVRFGLVLYKDRGDEYITKIVPFTAKVDDFRKQLAPVRAGGGGDGPEDLESALDDAVNKMDWNRDGLRLAFVITDAEAHLDYGREYNYIKAALDAKAMGIKLFSIGTGGLPLAGEYLLRQVSQLTDAKYIFLTYGERGESEGGAPGSVSHHTGANFETDKLEAIIIRFVKEEVAYLSDHPLLAEDDYFSAQKIESEERDETLSKLFKDALGSLADYSTYRISPESTCAILPVFAADSDTSLAAEYFAERLMLAAAELKRWRTVERKDFQKILDELELQLSGITDPAKSAELGKILGAELTVVPSLFKRADSYELFLRLIRVSTAEVLAVSRAKIAFELGL